MKILSTILMVISVALSFKHGLDAFQPGTAEQAKTMADLGISKSMMPYIGMYSILLGITLLFPASFFVSNLLNAFTIVLIMVLSLKAGVVKMALIEIPFLAIPLLLIWLKHPLKQS